MKKEKTRSEKSAQLRHKAEQKLNSNKTKSTDLRMGNEADAKKLLHELKVHQIELEMQNDELRKAQLKLEETYRKYFDLYDLAPVGYLILDEKGTILELNLTAATMLGEERTSVVNKNLNSFITRTKRDLFYLHMEKVKKSRSKQSCELILKKKDGTEFYGHLVCLPILNEKEGISSFRISVSDITERKQSEMKLLKSEKRFKDLVDLLPEAVIETDINLNLTYVNKRGLEMSGYSEEDFKKGLNGFDLLTEESQIDAKEYFRLRLAGKDPGTIEYSARKKDGTIYPILFHADSIISNGKITGIRGLIIDISERKQAEYGLYTAKAFLDSVINTIADPIFVKDDKRNFVLVNDALCTIVGRSREELLGKDGDDMFPKEQVEVFRKIDFKVLDTGEEDLNEEFLSNLTSGEISTIVTHKSRYTDPAGKHFLVGVIRDMTELKLSEVKLKEKNIKLEKQIKKSEEQRIANLVILNDLNETTVELKSKIVQHQRAEEQIKQDLKEKTALLQELYHRTKNNMQIISSILNMHGRQSHNEFIKTVFRDMINKIRSMSLVHQHLLIAKDLSKINLGEYIKDISNNLLASYKDPSTEISLSFELEDVFVSIDSAIPLGLILNELIINMLMHAFQDRTEGVISFKLTEDDGQIILHLGDNGLGLQDDLNIMNIKSMGLSTVYLLIKQLRGEIKHNVDNGLKWYISFSDNRFSDRLKMGS